MNLSSHKKLIFALLCLLLFTSKVNADDGNYRLPAVHQAQWEKECAACHMLYHPNLLPARSWIMLMDNLEHHFNMNAQLPPETNKEIKEFLSNNAADQGMSVMGRKISQSIDKNTTPLRLSNTLYFYMRHDEVPPFVFKRKSIGSSANCVACHKNAEQGIFSESEIKIPK